MVEIEYKESFNKQYEKISDKTTRLRIQKQIKKLAFYPEAGKPLKYDLKEFRSIRVPPFRIIDRLEGDVILVCCFEHRKNAYLRS